MNNFIETSTFSEQLKYAYVKPFFFTKKFWTDKKNYRLISILLSMSKICERCLNKQLEEYFQALLSTYQCGFQEIYSAINALFPMMKISQWRRCLWVVLTDLSKSFNCLPHELLTAKTHAYGVYMPSVKLLHSYLNQRKQSEIIWHVHFVVGNYLRSSILRPLLINIFLSKLFQFFLIYILATT